MNKIGIWDEFVKERPSAALEPAKERPEKAEGLEEGEAEGRGRGVRAGEPAGRGDAGEEAPVEEEPARPPSRKARSRRARRRRPRTPPRRTPPRRWKPSPTPPRFLQPRMKQRHRKQPAPRRTRPLGPRPLRRPPPLRMRRLPRRTSEGPRRVPRAGVGRRARRGVHRRDVRRARVRAIACGSHPRTWARSSAGVAAPPRRSERSSARPPSARDTAPWWTSKTEVDEPTVVVGVVTGVHGLRGDVSVQNRSDNPDRWAPGGTVLREDGTALTIESSRRHGRRMLVKFAGDRGPERSRTDPRGRPRRPRVVAPRSRRGGVVGASARGLRGSDRVRPHPRRRERGHPQSRERHLGGRGRRRERKRSCRRSPTS